MADGALGGLLVHVAVAGAVQSQVAQEARAVPYGHGHVLFDGPAEPLGGGEGGAPVHPDRLPPDGVGPDGLVKEERVGAQAPQLKGGVFPPYALAQGGGQVLRDLVPEFQMGVVIGHDGLIPS